MNRPYFDQSDYYRRSGKNIPLAVSTSERDNLRTLPIAHRVNPSPPHDDVDRVNGQNRRRIAVACSRCRKRKIKCSGDPGDGQGCTNCKNANAEPGLCQFLRVNSGNLVCAPPPAAMEWPYAASGSASRIAPYGSGSSHYAPNSAAQPPPAAFPGLTAVPSNRLEQGVPYNMEFDPFGYSQSQYLSQGQEATNPYGAQEVSRPWASTGVSSRWVTNGSFEQEMPSRCNSQTYPYASPPSSSGSTLDGSLFPGLSQLANALPAPNFSIDRVLPNPLAGNGTQYSDNNLGASDSNPYLPSHPSNARTAVSWPHERLGAGNVPAAASTSANSLTSMVGGKTSSTSEPQEHTFGYIPVSHSPSSDNGPIASDFSAQNSNSSMISLADQLCSKSSYGPESSSDSLLRSSNSSNNLYTYSSSSNAKRGSQSLFSSGTLTNGEPYTPHVRQTPHHTLTYLMQRHEPMDQHSRASHQTPIASVGSSRR